jgi:hypothetical protein
MSALTVDVMIPMLTSLNAILTKAAAFAEVKKLEAGTLENARLAPDMFALRRQVQLASDFAKNSVARLAGIEAPKMEDSEQTLAELQARVTKTIAYLGSVDRKLLDDSETRHIVVPLRTRTLDLNGLPFLQKWVLPNFYFHVTSAYAILRHNGVEVGKHDFLGGV